MKKEIYHRCEVCFAKGNWPKGMKAGVCHTKQSKKKKNCPNCKFYGVPDTFLQAGKKMQSCKKCESIL